MSIATLPGSATALPCVELTDLLAGLVPGAPRITLGSMCSDSRELRSGALFIALRGDAYDGRNFLADAAQAGAVAALVEKGFEVADAPLPCIAVADLRQHLGELASRFYGRPSRLLNIAAVTGTNGKTTVSHLLAQLVRGAGYDCGVIGTLGASLDGEVRRATHTTPDAISLQGTLADWSSQAVPFVSMEASSHALHQGRLNAVEVDTAIFTNLTRDHLDYHADMASYGAAKAQLFQMPGLRTAILNAEDPFSETIAAQLASQVRVLRYGGSETGADVALLQLDQGPAGLRLRVASPWGRAVIECPLLGRFNALNLLAAFSAAAQAGLPFDGLLRAAATLRPVPGRMEPLRLEHAPLVVIDYAHTPDALAQVLAALRPQTAGRLIAVFGCGGDRDRGKRAAMARVVSATADVAVLTSDNPRSEDPRAILADMEAGMHSEYTLIVERGEAIRHAIETAVPGDCVLIAGKGHEDYQLIGAARLPFSDSQHALQALEDYAQ
ncbi:MAG: UDP-N-acetylmuramoyl-L-alanyl-D-glutamate--2,6-diaminopimelate ligase [Halieaceae bacterium]|jgi:UDP-N-acetylmuramoyl-L-alanyl-D-glutamate--2,6-diaminopimelate ligase